MNEQNENSYSRTVAGIKSDLSKFSKVSVLNCVLTTLEATAAGDNAQAKIMTHIPFLVLKWAILSEIDGVEQLTHRELQRISDRIFSLQGLASKLESNEPFELKLRAMIKQQFATQVDDKEEFLALSRQALWFTKCGNDYFSQKFEEITGLKLESFFKLAFLFSVLTLGNSDKQLVRYEIGSLLCQVTPGVSTTQLASFLNLLSSTVNGIPIFLKKFCLADSPTWEYFQETPFIKKPMIQHDGYVYIANKKLWNRSLSSYVSDFLKENFSAEFKVHFGKVFEKYVGRLIEKSGLPYIDESCILTGYQKKQKYQKVVDFVIEDDCHVYVDAKAIEPSQRISTSHSASEILGQLESSYIKAIWQGQECCFNLESKATTQPKENFLIVVVHQDHFFNSGTKVEHVLIPNLSSQIFDEFGKIPIPLSNIYYLTIYDFERLMRLVSDSKENLSKFLRQCRDEDSLPETSRMLFRMHIDCLENAENDNELIDFSQECLENVRQMILENNKYWGGKIYQFLQARALLSRELSV